MKETNQATKYWDEAYQTGQYLNRWDYKQPAQELVGFVAAGLIPEKGSCLDMGCGAGNEAIFLSELGYHVTGIDFSTNALEIAKARAKAKNVTVAWVNGPATKTGLASNSFDFINDRGCFHHLIDNEREQYANEVNRLLKSGGHLLIRGCRDDNMQGFHIVNEKTIDQFFNRNIFIRGHILPITLISDTGSLNCNVVVLTKK